MTDTTRGRFGPSIRRASFAAALFLAGCATQRAAHVEINLVALNDFHGHLDAGRFSFASVNDKQARTISAGGIDTIAAALQAWRAEDKDLLLVGAGDLVGASPAMSSMWADEPSITAMNLLGLRASSVGNHEFDHGRGELLRQQNGGCASVRSEQACKFTPNFAGAKFSYLAANVIDSATGKPLLPAYRIEQVRGVKIGLIGAVLKGTPAVVLASGIAGLQFIDEAEAINGVLPELKAQGVTVFVALVHQGGHSTDYFDEPGCRQLQGPVLDIIKKLDPAIRLIVSGHTHSGYLCQVGGRVVTQAEMGGHVLSRIRLSIDAGTGSVRDINVRNVVMTPGAYPPDARVSDFLQQIRLRSQAVLTRPVARLAVATVPRAPNSSGESALGDLVADATLDAARALGAQIAFMNHGGMRMDLEAGVNLVASAGQVQMVLPFSNSLVMMTLTGAQIRALLEQQFAPPQTVDGRSLLQISDGFSYRWDASLPEGRRIVASSMMLEGVPLADAGRYRVVVNNFLAEGGDNFSIFRQGSEKIDTGILDLDAFTRYLGKRDRAGQPAGSVMPAARILRID